MLRVARRYNHSREREKNLTLEASIVEEKMKVEKLTIELSLANDSIRKLTKEHSSVNDQIASLKNEKSIAQESLTSLKEKYQNLELNYSTLWASTSTSPKATEVSNVSTSDGCKRCYKIDVNAYATNLVELEKKNKEIHRLEMILKNGCKCQEQSNKTIYKSSRHPSIKEGIGYNRYDGKANGRNIINGVSCVKFNKGVALDELICKANNKVYIPKIQPTSDKTKQSEALKPQGPLPRCYASVVGARMARLWSSMLVLKRGRKL